MKQKNSTFHVAGNIPADHILFIIESLDILSSNFRNKIIAVVLTTLTNFENKRDEISSMIEDIIELMEYTTIFSDKFKETIRIGLDAMYQFELNKKDNE